MSRSRRKTPKRGITSAETEKDDKRRANRKARRRVKGALAVQPGAEVLPLPREVSDVWNFAKDGEQYFGTRLGPKGLRK